MREKEIIYYDTIFLSKNIFIRLPTVTVYK